MQRSAVVKNKNLNKSTVAIERYIDMNTVMFILMGFFLSRSILIGAVAPLGIAFFICIVKIDKYRIPVFLSTLMGIILSLNDTSYMIKYAISLIVFMLIAKKLKEINSIPRMAFIGTGVILPLSIGQALLSSRTLYDFLLCGLEAIIVFAAIYVFSFGVNLLNNSSSKISVKTEESISIALLVAFSIMGIGNLAIFGISIRVVLCTVLILIASIVGGETMGATSGVIVGVAFLINNAISSIYMGIYAFAGLVSGAFSRLNKYLCILGYILSWIIIYAYTSGISSNIMELRDIMLASLIVIILPNKFFDKVRNIIKSSVASNDVVYDYINRSKDITNSRLVSMYKTYNQLANTFDRIREKEKILDQRDIASVIDMIHSDECKNCGMKRMCWESRFQHTYSMIYNILEVLEEKGQVSINDVSEEFRKECLRAEPIVKTANHYYKMFVLDYNWNTKFSESRKLIAEQIRSISKSIENLSNDFEQNVILDLSKEKEIYDELERNNVQVNKVSYITSGEDDFEITIDNTTCRNGRLCEESILNVVSGFTGETLSMQKIGCNCLGQKCSVKFCKAQKYKAVTQVSSMSRDGHILCGDNYTYMDINDGKYMMAISDGMGKGKKAYEESSITIDILEKMMDAKFDDEIIINTINNMLILKSTDEMFSTLDLGIIDLKRGRLETIKMGACSTYIKRKNGGVDLISSSSLPVGIIGDVKLDRQQAKISDGDYIIMVSDGIVDAGKNNDLGDNWLIYFLQDIETTNPKEISNLILDRALELQGEEIEDDMTSLVTKICTN